MSELAIRASGVGKRYKLGRLQEKYLTLRDTLVRAIKAPFQRARAEAEDPWVWALKDVAFEVREGEVLGIVGRNGAGKSTLLKVLSRITEPSTGFIEMHGRVGSLLEVGTGFHPELSGRENIFLNAAILGMRRGDISKNFDAIVSFAEVEKFIDTPVKHYSSGMYLRLAFAVAAHLEPEILVIDEVLAVGDANFQKKCLGKMEEVAHAGRTVLFVSHNMAAVERLCTRAMLLEQGTVATTGPVREVLNRYLTSETGQLGERKWPDSRLAPGDGVVRMRAVRAVDEKRTIVNQVRVTETFELELEFEVFEAGHRLDVVFYLYDSSGNIVFVTQDSQSQEWRARTRPVGVHRSRCRVPANLLNEGRLSVLAGISTPPTTLHALERDAICIDVLDDMESTTGARGDYTREWPGGAVRPLLQWSFEHFVGEIRG